MVFSLFVLGSLVCKCLGKQEPGFNVGGWAAPKTTVEMFLGFFGPFSLQFIYPVPLSKETAFNLDWSENGYTR